MNGITDSCIDKVYKKSRLVIQAHNDNKNLVLTQLLKIQRAYNINWDFYIWQSRKPILLLGNSSDSIIKVIKLLYNVSEARINWCAIYHLHYKEKLGMIKSTVKIIKLLCYEPKVNKHLFAIYYPYYKKNFEWHILLTTSVFAIILTN